VELFEYPEKLGDNVEIRPGGATVEEVEFAGMGSAEEAPRLE
jgi:hypothetical protein